MLNKRYIITGEVGTGLQRSTINAMLHMFGVCGARVRRGPPTKAIVVAGHRRMRALPAGHVTAENGHFLRELIGSARKWLKFYRMEASRPPFVSEPMSSDTTGLKNKKKLSMNL